MSLFLESRYMRSSLSSRGSSGWWFRPASVVVQGKMYLYRHGVNGSGVAEYLNPVDVGRPDSDISTFEFPGVCDRTKFCFSPVPKLPKGQ